MNLPAPNILQVKRDPNLFAPHLEPLETWAPYDTFLAAAFGLELPDPALYEQCTGRKAENAVRQAVREAWMVVGRRGGKSRITALIATYLACFYDYSPYLSPGEIGLVPVLATDRGQARIITRYIEAFILNTPLLTSMVVRRTAETIELSNRITIQVTSATLRAPRGYTVVAALCDEIAFWRSDDSANPDVEILTSLRPAMSTIPNAMLICLSSPYARRGAMWEAYRKYYGEDREDVLVWQAPTWVMNPTIPQSYLDREKEKDPVAFQSEHGAEFRGDIKAAYDPDWIDTALSLPNIDRPKSSQPKPYVAYVDMSGGRSDSATLAIAHGEPDGSRVGIDLLRRWSPPFSPSAVVDEMTECLQRYGLHTVSGDDYGAELRAELFSKAGVTYRISKESASDLYLQAVSIFSTGMLEAPDHPVLRAELTALERRTRTSGKDLITHPEKGHDDLANAAVGAAVNARRAVSESAGDTQVFPRDWILAAQQRWTNQQPRHIPQSAIGVAARGMQDSVLAPRYGVWYAPLVVIPAHETPDGRHLAGQVFKHRTGNSVVVIDVGEPRGAQCLSHLKENEQETFPFRSLDDAHGRTDTRQMEFADRRSEASWRLREALDPNRDGVAVALPPDPELVSELVSYTWKETPKGIRIAPKEDVSGRIGGRASNRADAVIMAWYRGSRHADVFPPDERLPGFGRKRRPQVNFGPRRTGFASHRHRR